MYKYIAILSLMLVLAASVSAGFSARCQGNTLMYYDLDNKLITRDCSILHSGQGQVFRGICKTFEGGADCFRTEGAVTPDYRNAVRGFVYNDSISPWDPIYDPTTTTLPGTITTTTLVSCPTCQVCQTCDDCTSLRNSFNSINVSYTQYKDGYNDCNLRIRYLVSRDVLDKTVKDKDATISDRETSVNFCRKQLETATNDGEFYKMLAVIAVVILVVVIAIWVKFEWIGDPKLKDGILIGDKN